MLELHLEHVHQIEFFDEAQSELPQGAVAKTRKKLTGMAVMESKTHPTVDLPILEQCYRQVGVHLFVSLAVASIVPSVEEDEMLQQRLEIWEAWGTLAVASCR